MIHNYLNNLTIYLLKFISIASIIIIKKSIIILKNSYNNERNKNKSEFIK